MALPPTARNSATTPQEVEPVACTLTTKQAAERTLEWTDLQHRCTSVESIAGGVRMTMPASMAADVRDLARREVDCCSFLVIETAVEADVLTLDITSPNPDALPIISVVSGIELS